MCSKDPIHFCVIAIGILSLPKPIPTMFFTVISFNFKNGNAMLPI